MNVLERLADPDGAGEIGPFQAMRIRRVEAGDALDRRLEMVEAAFLDQRRQLRAEAAGPRRFMDDHAAPGLLDRCLDRLDIERHQRPQIDDLGIDPRVGDHRGADMDHRAIAQDRQRLARPHDHPRCRARPCNSRSAPRRRGASTNFAPAGPNSRRTGRCRCAWARRRAPGHCPRSPRSAAPWHHRASTGSPSSCPTHG